MKKGSVLTHMKGEPQKLAMKLEHESALNDHACAIFIELIAEVY